MPESVDGKMAWNESHLELIFAWILLHTIYTKEAKKSQGIAKKETRIDINESDTSIMAWNI